MASKSRSMESLVSGMSKKPKDQAQAKKVAAKPAARSKKPGDSEMNAEPARAIPISRWGRAEGSGLLNQRVEFKVTKQMAEWLRQEAHDQRVKQAEIIRFGIELVMADPSVLEALNDPQS